MNTFGFAGAVALDHADRLLRQVEGLGHARGREQPERLLGEGVHRLDRAVGVGVAAHGVEALEKRLAVGEAVDGDAAENHVFAGLAHRAERGQRRPEEAGARLVVRAVRAGVAQADERRDARIDRPLQLRHRGAELRPTAARGRLAGVVAVVHLDGVVVGLVADQRADDDELVHDPGQPREGFANLDAGDVGGGRLPRAGDFLGGVGLEIEHVLVRRAADQVDQDHRLVRRPDPGGRLGPQEAGQGEAAKAQGADPEEAAAGQAVRDDGRGSGEAMAGRHWLASGGREWRVWVGRGRLAGARLGGR